MGDRDEGVRHAEIRILPHARHQEELVARGVAVEVVAVVEIPIAGEDVVEGVRGLMGEILVHRADRHEGLPGIEGMGRGDGSQRWVAAQSNASGARREDGVAGFGGS
jgi:hypothetical protein